MESTVLKYIAQNILNSERQPITNQDDHNNLVQYIIDCVRMSNTTKCALTA